ncbi:hypothetical protein CapIbe_017153 [Capra ibex]
MDIVLMGRHLLYTKGEVKEGEVRTPGTSISLSYRHPAVSLTMAPTTLLSSLPPPPSQCLSPHSGDSDPEGPCGSPS